MRNLTLVVSMLFSAVTIAGAQGTTQSDTTVVADVRSKAETVSSVAVETTNTPPAPARSGFGKRVAKRSGAKPSTSTANTRTTTTVTTSSAKKSSSAPVTTKVKTETEIAAENKKLQDEIEKSNALPTDFGDASSSSSSSSSKHVVDVTVAPKDAAKPPVRVVITTTSGHIGKPFARKTDQLGFVNAVRTCNRKILLVRCDDLLDEFNRVIGERFNRHFSNLDQIAEFLASAEEGACPVGETANLSRVLGTRVRAKDTWQRPFEPGERCLYVDNLLVLSLRCGNPAKSTHYLRAPRQEAAAPARRPERTKPKVVFIPPAEPLGSVETPSYKKGFPTKRVVGGLVALALIDQALCQWVDDAFCIVKINMHQSQSQKQTQ